MLRAERKFILYIQMPNMKVVLLRTIYPRGKLFLN